MLVVGYHVFVDDISFYYATHLVTVLHHFYFVLRLISGMDLYRFATNFFWFGFEFVMFVGCLAIMVLLMGTDINFSLYYATNACLLFTGFRRETCF